MRKKKKRGNAGIYKKGNREKIFFKYWNVDTMFFFIFLKNYIEVKDH